MSAGSDSVAGVLAYPREWFEVSRHSREPRAKMFTRETASMLFYHDHSGEERRTSKRDTYSIWYPTREDAEAAIAAHRARQDAAEAKARLRDAAPELLEALESYVEFLEPQLMKAVAAGYPNEPHVERLERAKAALAKARSPQ